MLQILKALFDFELFRKKAFMLLSLRRNFNGFAGVKCICALKKFSTKNTYINIDFNICTLIVREKLPFKIHKKY
jgi:isocitrate/isopropylmalate dehydrogenase